MSEPLGDRRSRPAVGARGGPVGPVGPVGLIALGVLLLLVGCAGPSYQYRYRPGRSAALLPEGIAVAPPKAPPAVQAAVAAGNRIAGSPYRRGGGHGSGADAAYDCSGAASYVLAAAGALRGGATTSRGFRHYGRRGEGEWISVYARRGHVFLVVADLRFDTGWNGGGEGPAWSKRSRPARGYAVRHPPGL